MKLQEKVAIITGSTAGIGFATATAYLKEGARVVINGRDQQRTPAKIPPNWTLFSRPLDNNPFMLYYCHIN